MMKINLNVDTNSNKVIANEGGKPKNKGNLCAPEGEKLKWQGKHTAGSGEFVVTFEDDDPATSPDWPFVEPPTDPLKNELRIPATNGNEQRTIKPGLWKYSVEYTGTTGVTPLDPMMIVRDSSNGFMYFAGHVLAFAAGAVLAAMVLRARRLGTR
jgi:hypothetical protein